MAIGALRRESRRARRLSLLSAGWLLGGLLTYEIAKPMLKEREGRRENTVDRMATMSVPLVQYLLPYPSSIASRIPLFERWRAAVEAPWEAWPTVPIGALSLMLFYICWRRAPGDRWALGLTFVLAVTLSLGPYLHAVRSLPPGEGVRAPLYYLIRASTLFTLLKAPGRMSALALFPALIASGWVLNSIRVASARSGRAALWPAALCVFISINLAWSFDPHRAPITPNPIAPEFYRRLGARPGAGAVLDVPFDFYNFPHYNYYQLTHKRPTVTSTLFHDALRWRSLEFIHATEADLTIFAADNREYDNLARWMRVADPAFLTRLGRYGIQYVVFHQRSIDFAVARGFARPEAVQGWREVEEAWAERRIYEDAETRVYLTDPRIR
jgi:hypothetical protein